MSIKKTAVKVTRIAVSILALILLVNALSIGAVPANADTVPETDVTRIYGANRFETALKAADEIVKLRGGQLLDSVIIVSGMDFADALVGSYLAVVKEAPILLSGGNNTQQLHDFIRANLNIGGTVYILGGKNAVAESVGQGLDGYRVKRLSGATRFETNLAILKETGVSGDDILVCTGFGFADSLSASAVGKPILLVNTINGTLTQEQQAYLQGFSAKKIYILGGTNAVSQALENQLRTYAAVERIGGQTRYETSVLVAEEFFPDPQSAVLAYAISYPDGLCGGLLANMSGGPLILTQDQNAQNARAFVQSMHITQGTVLGGSTLVSDDTVRYIFEAAQSSDPEQTERCSITYVLNGGENDERNPSQYTPGETHTLYAPTKEYHTFAGWYLDSAFTTEAKRISSADSGNLTLYAKWEPCEYSITYELDGGRNSSRNPETYSYGDSFLLQGASKSYCTFEGWYLDSTFETRVTQINATDSGDITLYAKWEPYTYNITYVLNNGANSENNPAEYTYGDALILEEPTRENYTFYGWYLESSFKTKLEQIPANHAGDITLYAKWHLAQLNVPGEGMENMIWTWWYYPQVISTEDAVYWGYATNEGYCGVAKYDIATGTTTTNHLKRLSAVDDHNGLAVTVLEDGRIMCVYAGGHDSNNEMHIRISSEPGSIESFDTNVVLLSAGKTCYAQIIQYNGKIYIFHRVNSKSWAYRYSEDGITWSDEQIFVSATMQYYCKIVPTTQDGLVRVCMYSNPTAGDPRIRMGFLDLDTGMLYNSDGKTALGTTKVAYDKFDILIDQPQGKVQRMFDVAISAPEEVNILYTVFSDDKTANDSVYYLYNSGNVIELCNGGVPLWNPKYQGGASFAGSDRIILARNESGSDFVEIYSHSGSQVSLVETVWSERVGGNVRSARPIVDVNGKYFLWHRGYYNPNSYTDFDTDAMLETLP